MYWNQKSDYYNIDWLVVWLVVLRIYVALALFQPYRDLEAGDNQSLKSGKAGNRTRTSCSASQELNHSATAAPYSIGDRSECMLHINQVNTIKNKTNHPISSNSKNHIMIKFARL